MTEQEFQRFTGLSIDSYADQVDAAGEMAPLAAKRYAREQTHQLLPEGRETPGMLLLSAEADGSPIGGIWLALDRPGRPGTAWVYDILVDPQHRGRGYGRAIMESAEKELSARGVTTVGLNVFRHNTPASRLYARIGYQVTSQQMAKHLDAGHQSASAAPPS